MAETDTQSEVVSDRTAASAGTRLKRVLLVTAGSLSLSLGVAGIFLPVLPTTPFLLLSAACYIRSSRKLYLWLVHHKVLGIYVRSYLEYRAVSLRAKIISIMALWITITCSVLFFVNSLVLRIALICIAIGVTVYLLHIKTLTKEMMNSNDSESSL